MLQEHEPGEIAQRHVLPRDQATLDERQRVNDRAVTRRDGRRRVPPGDLHEAP